MTTTADYHGAPAEVRVPTPTEPVRMTASWLSEPADDKGAPEATAKVVEAPEKPSPKKAAAKPRVKAAKKA